LNIDICIDYKIFFEKFKKVLFVAIQNYIFVYFDNINNKILNFCLIRIKCYSCIAVCNIVFNYNTSSPTVLKNYFEVIIIRLEIRDFIIFDFLTIKDSKKIKKALEVLRKTISNNKIKIDNKNKTIVEISWKKISNI